MQQQILGLRFPASYGAHNFCVTSCNRKAYQWIQQWPQWPSCASILSGPGGAGKTHLAHIWAERARALFLKPQDFLDSDPVALGGRASAFIWEGEIASALEEPFFHFFNHVKESQKWLLLVHEKAPHLWPLQLADLRSRLLAVTHIPLDLPEDDLLQAILTKVMRDQQLMLSPQVMRYLLTHCPRSCREMEKLAHRLAAYAHERGKAITLTDLPFFWGRSQDDQGVSTT